MRVWVGPDPRLTSAYEMVVGGLSHTDVWDIEEPDSDTPLFMVSDVIREQSQRLDSPIPTVASTNLLYDNGEVQVYRVRGTSLAP